MEKTNIIISNPCDKDWNEMTPESNGKYCGACNKTVIDFTTWEVEEIKKYLQSKNEKVCGHFKTLQVAVKRPKHHQFLVDLYLKIEKQFTTPLFKTLTLSLIVLCMTVVGCNRPTKTEELAMNNFQDTTRNKITNKDKTEATSNSRLRLDLLAKNVATQEMVIIENQLEETDHSHLGKLLTYASLFDSKTIIWVVRDIRPEHELAIGWLNNNTKDPLNLFLIRVQLVSIDNSLVAPLFTIISKPYNIASPKIKKDFGVETIELIYKKETLEKTVLDTRIIDFFNKSIKPGNTYQKNDLFELLKIYNPEFAFKYNIRFSREIKRDLLLWADFIGYKINQRQFERNDSRDFKQNGKEYFAVDAH